MPGQPPTEDDSNKITPTSHTTPASAPTAGPSRRASRATARAARPSITRTTSSTQENNPNARLSTKPSSIHARLKPSKKSGETMNKIASSLGPATQPINAPKVKSPPNIFQQNGLVCEASYWVTSNYRKSSVLPPLRDDNPSETCNWCGKPWPRVRCEDCRKRRDEFFACKDSDGGSEVECG